MTSSKRPDSGSRQYESLKAIVLAPSWGLGGGVERYIKALVENLETEAGCTIVPLLRPGDRLTRFRKVGLVVRACGSAWRGRRLGDSLVVIVAHVGLLPAAVAVRLVAPKAKLFLIGHGAEIWSGAPSLRLARRIALRLVAVSEFTAGSLVRYGDVGVLPPVLEAGWAQQLLTAERRVPEAEGSVLKVLTVFRLSVAREKGLAELLEAVEVARAGGSIQMTVAGSGELPGWAVEMCRQTNARVVANPSDEELAQLYAGADIVALCTRVRPHGRRVSGEGFGLALLEGQLAGTAVIAPSSGGSGGAYVNGVTGLQPADEGVESLSQVLRWYVDHPQAAATMGQEGRRWATAVVDRKRSLDQVRATFFGRTEPVIPADGER